jgi:hypothetical protein
MWQRLLTACSVVLVILLLLWRYNKVVSQFHLNTDTHAIPPVVDTGVSLSSSPNTSSPTTVLAAQDENDNLQFVVRTSSTPSTKPLEHTAISLFPTTHLCQLLIGDKFEDVPAIVNLGIDREQARQIVLANPDTFYDVKCSDGVVRLVIQQGMICSASALPGDDQSTSKPVAR